MTIDQLLRASAPTEADLRAETDRIRPAVLGRLDRRAPRRGTASRLRYAIAALTAALAMGGGVAYANGTLPSFFHDSVDDFAGQYGDDDLSSRMRQIVDLTLPDGSRFAAWKAVGEKAYCAAELDNWDGSAQPGDPGFGGVGCGTIDTYALNQVTVAIAAGRIASTRPSGPAGRTVQDVVRARPDVWYPVIYGDTDTDATQVRVTGTLNWTGRAVDVLLPIDPSTRAFAAVLPGEWRQHEYPAVVSADPDGEHVGPADGLTLTFLDENGATLEHRSIRP